MTKEPRFSIKDAAHKLGVAEVTLRRWVSDQKIAHTRLGGRIYFTQDNLDEMVVPVDMVNPPRAYRKVQDAAPKPLPQVLSQTDAQIPTTLQGLSQPLSRDALRRQLLNRLHTSEHRDEGVLWQDRIYEQEKSWEAEDLALAKAKEAHPELPPEQQVYRNPQGQ